MPRGNGTGPMGMGSMTGRAAGYCAGFNAPGSMNNAGGRGMGRGFGRGRGIGLRYGGFGWRNIFNATGIPGFFGFGANAAAFQKPGPDAERAALKTQADALQTELEIIRKRIEEIEAKTPAE